MLTGIEKPIPVESLAIAVLIPITAPVASRSGPAAVAGLIAAVSLDEVVELAALVVIWRPVAETIPLVTVSRTCRAAADRDDDSPTLRAFRVRRAWPRSDLVRRSLTMARSVSVVDSVDRAAVLRAVLQLDGQLVAAGDDVTVRQDPAVWKSKMKAGADPLNGIAPFGSKKGLFGSKLGLFGSTVAAAPVSVVIRTTAGPALAATLIDRDDSSIVDRCLPALVDSAFELAAGTAGRTSAPVALSAMKVPPEASTADRSAPTGRRPVPAPDLAVVLAVPGRSGAVSNQCSAGTGRLGVDPARWPTSRSRPPLEPRPGKVGQRLDRPRAGPTHARALVRDRTDRPGTAQHRLPIGRRNRPSSCGRHFLSALAGLGRYLHRTERHRRARTGPPSRRQLERAVDQCRRQPITIDESSAIINVAPSGPAVVRSRPRRGGRNRPIRTVRASIRTTPSSIQNGAIHLRVGSGLIFDSRRWILSKPSRRPPAATS